MKPYFYAAVLIITILLPLSSHANTFCVSDATGLQTALTTAAGNGEDDTVQIEQGTYVGSFIYASTEAFSLTVEGGYTSSCSSRVVDPDNTVLDANNSGVVLAISSSGVDTDFTIEGLKMHNGNVLGNRGGGLFIGSAGGSVLVANSNVSDNYCHADGGGLYVDMAESITLAGNTVTFNEGSGAGGIYLNEPTFVTMENNTITNNLLKEGVNNGIGGIRIHQQSTTGRIELIGNTISYNDGESGGGIFISGGSMGNDGQVTVSNNTIGHNSCSSNGESAGIYIMANSVMLDKNSIHDNQLSDSGGGVEIQARIAQLTRNIIFNNSAEGGGGMSYSYIGGQLTLINNIFTNNNASIAGGGILIAGGTNLLTLINNTVFNNTGGSQGGGGIRFGLSADNDEAFIYNNIVWNNISSLGADLYISNDGNGNYLPSPVNLYNNDFDQSTLGTYIELPFTIDPSNLDNEDPLFVDAPYDDYHLTDLSPCIDTGRLEGAPEDDMDGHSRPQGDGVDIGADEYIPPDADDDGVPNEVDNCPFDANPDQIDTDNDCIGDECDDFPNDYDPTVPDSDGDGVGNDCDVCPYDFDDDIDADGLCGNEDNCPDIPNGPDLGSCINILTGIVGTTCMNDVDCGTGESCSNDQEDRDNNGSGDACDIGTFCRGLADYDQDVDAQDVTVFLSHFGRSPFNNPCPQDGPAACAKTGQTTSYATGDDGDHERGVALVTPRFTDNGDGTVLDNLTGLIWLKNANCFGQRTWNDALSDCNGLADGSCGLSDGSQSGAWRLPNKKELISLTHDGYYNPALPNTAGTGQWSQGDPFNNVQSEWYCSSTSYVLDTGHAWNVNMVNGGLDAGGAKFNHNYVWCVRGGH